METFRGGGFLLGMNPTEERKEEKKHVKTSFIMCGSTAM